MADIDLLVYSVRRCRMEQRGSLRTCLMHLCDGLDVICKTILVVQPGGTHRERKQHWQSENQL